MYLFYRLSKHSHMNFLFSDLKNQELECSVSPSLTRSSEKPITKSTHLHLSVVEGVTGGREIIVDAVAAEIADDTEEVDDGEIDELYVGMKKSAAAATKGLGNHNRSPLGHTP
ncbi:hypothetical protein RHGRI_008744 [Rhododendron griersonianum]|uniref:Uncharacterized protein n=1 Tax=Rhododendron griersonianum TaxID=479676 RepID=A0AAV6L3P7_9ERIC|nr:hypothetical protein RHGRI_008744 [Rhododendron griersonianum]